MKIKRFLHLALLHCSILALSFGPDYPTYSYLKKDEVLNESELQKLGKELTHLHFVLTSKIIKAPSEDVENILSSYLREKKLRKSLKVIHKSNHVASHFDTLRYVFQKSINSSIASGDWIDLSYVYNSEKSDSMTKEELKEYPYEELPNSYNTQERADLIVTGYSSKEVFEHIESIIPAYKGLNIRNPIWEYFYEDSITLQRVEKRYETPLLIIKKGPRTNGSIARVFDLRRWQVTSEIMLNTECHRIINENDSLVVTIEMNVDRTGKVVDCDIDNSQNYEYLELIRKVLFKFDFGHCLKSDKFTEFTYTYIFKKLL